MCEATETKTLCRKEVRLGTISPPVPDASTENPDGARRSVVPEMWASLAIGLIWLVVLTDALTGPLVVSNANGFTRLPSAIIVALFAWLATRVVAKYGFRIADDGCSSLERRCHGHPDDRAPGPAARR